MKKSDIYNGISKINEKYREDSGNFENIAMEFKRANIRRTEKFVSFAASLAIAVIVGVNLYDKNIINNSSMIKQSDSAENSHITAEIDYGAENKPNTVPSESNTIVNKNTHKSTLSDQKLSSSAISDLSAEEKTDPAKTTPDINESYNYDDNISEETAVIIPDPSEKPVNTIPDTTEEPVVVTERPVVTVPDTTESLIITRPDNTEDNDKDNTEEPSEQKPMHWEEMSIAQQYFMCTFEDTYYKTMNQTIGRVLIGEYLGTAEMDGYDLYNDRYYHCTAKAYEIKGISKTDLVAVLFDNEAEFFAYINYKLI